MTNRMLRTCGGGDVAMERGCVVLCCVDVVVVERRTCGDGVVLWPWRRDGGGW